MSTYLQGIQDRVEKVNPPQTDWQFEAQLLQTRQSKYDAGHTKLSEQYGKILNSGLTREQNIQAREEFFKTIDQDLRKVAGMDLSLASNVSKSEMVFNQIYDNDPLVKDMVWTKQYQSEMERANSFRDCVDPAKCGGEYWEDGVKAMNYKREEFKNMSNGESMGASAVRYVPYNNMMEKAIKDATAADLSVTRDKLNGRYIVRTKNGGAVVEPMTAMFNQLYKDNPDLHDMYKVQTYNQRKDWTYNAVASGEYKTLDEASAGYVKERSAEILASADSVRKGIDLDVSRLEARKKAIEDDFRNNRVTNVTEKKYNDEYAGVNADLENAMTAKSYTDMAKSAEKNMHNQTNMNAIGDILDNASAMTLFNNDLKIAAETMAHRDMEVTMTEDKFALADQAQAYDIQKINLEQRNRIALEEKKSELKMKEADGTPVKGAFAAASDHKIKQETVDNFNIVGSMYTFLGDGYNSNNIASMTEKEILAFMDSPNVVDRDKLKIAYKDAKAVEKKHKVAANIAALKSVEKGSDVDFSKLNWEEMDAETYNGLKRNLSADQFADLDVPMGVKFIERNKHVLFQYPNSDAMYYKEDDIWHRVYSDKDNNQVDETITETGNIWNLDTKATVLK